MEKTGRADHDFGARDVLGTQYVSRPANFHRYSAATETLEIILLRFGARKDHFDFDRIRITAHEQHAQDGDGYRAGLK
jgi:hypothetical protein